MNLLKFFSFIPFLLLALPCASFGDEDFLIDMYYDPSKTYPADESVVLETNTSEVYTSKTLVPVNTPPPNAQYWSPSEDHTNELTSENSDELGTPPPDNFDQTTPGTPPTVPTFSLSMLELDYSENGTGAIATISAINAVSYALSEELDYELFDLDDTTHELTFKNSPNYESPQDSNEDNIYQVVVVATNIDGSDSQTLKITIQNEIETPVFVPSNTDVVEFSSETGEYSVNVSDTNTADITLGGIDSAKFFFNSATGIISFDPNFEPEADASYSLIIEASNAEGSSFLTLTVNTNFDEESVVVPSGLLSATSEQFVMQQYRDFFARDADEGGLNWWTDQIESGNKERADLAMDFVYSAEYQNNIAPVVRLYFAYYNRLPDTGGLTFWIEQYINPDVWTLYEISDYFASSAEFVATYGNLDNGPYVTLTYNNVFGRAPDDGGFNFWKNELDTGNRTRGMAMVEHAESQEYKDKVSSEVQIVAYYFSLLRRAPDQGGFDYWVERLNNGDSAKGLIADFLYSAEYQGRDFTATH